jgi:hypothetical protein
VFKRGVGTAVLAQYLKDANKQVEVWLQVNSWFRVKGLGKTQPSPEPGNFTKKAAGATDMCRHRDSCYIKRNTATTSNLQHMSKVWDL